MTNSTLNKIFISLIVLVVVFISLFNLGDAINKISNIPSKLSSEKAINIASINQRLEPIYFDLRVSNIEEKETTVLDINGLNRVEKYVAILKELPFDYTLHLKGTIGEKNIYSSDALIDTRVNDVSNYLISLGIPKNRITVSSPKDVKWQGEYSMYAECINFNIIKKEEA